MFQKTMEIFVKYKVHQKIGPKRTSLGFISFPYQAIERQTFNAKKTHKTKSNM